MQKNKLIFIPLLSTPILEQNVPNSYMRSNKRLINTVRSLFSTGQKLTAVQINHLVRTNDARKIISTLRREGLNIQDMRLKDGCKLNWLVQNQMQTTLQFDGGTSS